MAFSNKILLGGGFGSWLNLLCIIIIIISVIIFSISFGSIPRGWKQKNESRKMDKLNKAIKNWQTTTIYNIKNNLKFISFAVKAGKGPAALHIGRKIAETRRRDKLLRLGSNFVATTQIWCWPCPTTSLILRALSWRQTDYSSCTALGCNVFIRIAGRLCTVHTKQIVINRYIYVARCKPVLIRQCFVQIFKELVKCN